MKNGDEKNEDEDYMSDAFLQHENKPGLMPKLFLDRHKRIENKTNSRSIKVQKKSLKLQEKEKRDEKLETPLDESNKGFAMLSKMGFKKGMGLGKEGHGRSEPISIKIKAGRSGLGKESEEERKRKLRIDAFTIKKKHRREEEVKLTVNFKMRVKNRLNDRQAILDLQKSQRACEQLDKSKDVLQPLKGWYWPDVEEKDDESKDTKTDESRSDEYEIVKISKEIAQVILSKTIKIKSTVLDIGINESNTEQSCDIFDSQNISSYLLLHFSW